MMFVYRVSGWQTRDWRLEGVTALGADCSAGRGARTATYPGDDDASCTWAAASQKKISRVRRKN
eukprot:1443956-Rhodomonas_salina.3